MKVEIRALNSIWRYSSIRLFRCLQKPIQNGGMKPTSWNSIPTVFFVSPRWGKSRNAFWTQFDDIRQFGFFAAWKSPPKMVVWIRPRGIRSQRCFFVSPRWGKSRNAFWTQFDDIRQFGFFAAWKSPPKMVVWNRRRGIRSQAFFSVSPRWGKSRNPFWTQFDDIRQFGFFAACKSPSKMVVWNRPRGIRSQRCFLFRPDGESRETRFELNLTSSIVGVKRIPLGCT